MTNSYSFGIRSRANDLEVAQIKAVAFLTLGLIITEFLIEFLYKFNPNNLPQFVLVCVFSGFLSCWLITESYFLSKNSKSNILLLLAIVQLVYAFSRELFLILNYQSDTYHQYQNAIQRLDFRAFPYILIYCVIFGLQLSQILKLFVEYVKSLDEDFQKILNSQPIALICFSRSDHKTIFINDHFKKLLGFKENDIPSINEWMHYFKKNATPCFYIKKGFSDFQTDMFNNRGENIIIRISREVMDGLIIDALVDVTEEERKNTLIRQNQKELLSRSIADKEFLLEQSHKAATEYSTENKILMSSLLKANKTLSSGALAASIAHELTQPLTAMNLNLELMLFKLNKKAFDSEKGKIIAQKIIADNVRIASIIHSLRAIFMEANDSFTQKSVNDMINSVTNLIAPECIKRNIVLQIEMASELSAIFRPDEIRQVLLNILGNAINILENIEDRQRIIRITAAQSENDVEITISDNGPGVDPSVEPTLFELLTTTKKDGMGLGLWLSKYILTKSGGDIKYLRLEGLGASFQIRLPIEFEAKTSVGGGFLKSQAR